MAKPATRHLFSRFVGRPSGRQRTGRAVLGGEAWSSSGGIAGKLIPAAFRSPVQIGSGCRHRKVIVYVPALPMAKAQPSHAQIAGLEANASSQRRKAVGAASNYGRSTSANWRTNGMIAMSARPCAGPLQRSLNVQPFPAVRNLPFPMLHRIDAMPVGIREMVQRI